ncbi:MAG: hypothetical protein ACI9VM_000777 [Candidatus Azotimanducaceae bacterium]|jgi:hypothetical protein
MDAEKKAKKWDKDEKGSMSDEIYEKNQASFEEVQKQSEKERKRIPWELLLLIAAILMSIYHFTGT